MAKRLTDKQKKRIIADYAESGSYNATAKKFGISHHTVKKLTIDDAESANKCQQKKEENTLDMLSYMDSRKQMAQQFIDLCFNELLTPAKLKDAKLREIATAMGIVVDKFTSQGKTIGATTEDLAPLSEMLKDDEDTDNPVESIQQET